MPEKAFCEECKKNVDFSVESKLMTDTLRDKEYQFYGKEARCSKCGSLVSVPYLIDENLNSLYDVFREENDIISLDKIRAIPQKYKIGKQSLSLILGWGAQTFYRYYEGGFPTKQYSDILIRLYNEPQFFSEILENKKSMLSAKAYSKSRDAVDSLIASEQKTDKPINLAIQYLLTQCGDTTAMSLQKALYYIQGFYFAFYKSFIFEEDCEAWVHGPVFRDAYNRYKDFGYNPIGSTRFFNDEMLTGKEKVVYDSVIKNICCYSGNILEQFTNNETPWIVTREELPISEPSDKVIKKEMIGAYFTEVVNKYHMVNPSDIVSYSRDMFARL